MRNWINLIIIPVRIAGNRYLYQTMIGEKLDCVKLTEVALN